MTAVEQQAAAAFARQNLLSLNQSRLEAGLLSIGIPFVHTERDARDANGVYMFNKAPTSGATKIDERDRRIFKIVNSMVPGTLHY